ncbi:MAG: ABC transporter ATP-binding protein [Bacteroidales bacterium]|nr:ABC transporter ATP-binding protein [Bacteroidales bacterium]
MHKEILTTKSLSIGYEGGGKNQKRLFSGLNLACRKGEIIGLIGRNGSGKSTLLKTLAGIIEPLDGNIFINDLSIKGFKRRELARQVSFVSTEVPVIPNLSVSELVSLGRYPHTDWTGRLSPEDIKQVNISIDQVDVGYLSGKPIAEISDGERQRAMIARALAQDTRIMILDEPTAFLDLPNKYEILRLLNHLAAKKGKAILFSTHDLGIAFHEADKIWLFLDENIITGAPEDLILNKKFFKLFDNSSLTFDLVKGEIRPERSFTGKLGVSGEGILKLWTVRALERIGIEAVDKDQELNLSIDDIDGELLWRLNDYKTELIFHSIYELCLHLKTIIN